MAVTDKIYLAVFGVLEDVHGRRKMPPDDVFKIALLIEDIESLYIEKGKLTRLDTGDENADD